jgi:SAM-dependent methyltransferase
LGIAGKEDTPVIGGDIARAVERHFRIATLLRSVLPESPHGVACEVGSGDCLAAADLLLGVGFREVILVEKKPITADERQKEVLRRLAAGGLPNRSEVFHPDGGNRLDSSRVRVIPEYFEKACLERQVDFLFSFDVVEHVEDLRSFFKNCRSVVAPGGIMVHKFDLSGHEFFEDPMPPLDFQTYPDWLYHLMFPKYRRACRRFLDEILDAAALEGFADHPSVTMIREAEEDYLAALRPLLRSNARRRSDEQLKPLDIVVRWSC